MNKRNLHFIPILAAGIFCFLSLVEAGASDEHYSHYNDIIRELSGSSTSAVSPDNNYDLDQIKFHAGLGLVTSRLNLALPSSMPTFRTLQGYEISFGIDLFSPLWIAQGALRLYDPETIGGGEVSLKEFDLLLKHKVPLERQFFASLGGGMTSRYLDFSSSVSGNFKHNNTTPASILMSGGGFQLSQAFLVELIASYRNRFVTDTVDRGSIDGTIRVSGQF